MNKNEDYDPEEGFGVLTYCIFSVLLFFILISWFLLGGCKHAEPAPQTPKQATYTSQVRLYWELYSTNHWLRHLPKNWKEIE